MVLPLSSEVEDISENKNEIEDWQDESDLDPNEQQFEEESESDARDFSHNQVSLSFSWSLMNQLRYLARTEGIGVEDLLIELVAEGVTKRAFEEQNKSLPSHLMTRNGYVHNSEDGNSNLQQPQMSHHALNNNRNQNNQTNRNKPGVQSRTNQYNNSPRYQGANNRNYQGNNRNNQQGNAAPFRQNAAPSYNSQQRYTPRPVANSNQSGSQTNQPSRFTTDNNENTPQPSKNRKY